MGRVGDAVTTPDETPASETSADEAPPPRAATVVRRTTTTTRVTSSRQSRLTLGMLRDFVAVCDEHGMPDTVNVFADRTSGAAGLWAQHVAPVDEPHVCRSYPHCDPVSCPSHGSDRPHWSADHEESD